MGQGREVLGREAGVTTVHRFPIPDHHGCPSWVMTGKLILKLSCVGTITYSEQENQSERRLIVATTYAPGQVVSRLRPNPSEPLANSGAIALLRMLRAAARQDGTSWSLPAERCDRPEGDNAVVERDRFADEALVAGLSCPQHRQAGGTQPIRG